LSRIPQLSAQECIRALERAGFVKIRQTGSHVFLRHFDGRTTVIPAHAREDVDRGLLAKILKHDVRIDVDEFLRLL
jgi:predicted RNA binding protein YcfA (HicA-like mRNA interferase family)